jgi:hypothetical protein
MRVELIKKYAVAIRELPKGTQLRVSNALGNELIKLKVAKELGVYTQEEEVEHMVAIAVDNEEKPKVKKVTKEKKVVD